VRGTSDISVQQTGESLEVFVRTTNLILVLAVSSSACYQYSQVEDAAPLPEPGAEVRAQLATPQSLELGSLTIGDVSRIEGDVYQSEGDTLSIFSRRVFSAYGAGHYTNGAVFYFDRSQFGLLEQRSFVPVKSGIAIGVVAAGVVAAVFLIAELGGGAEGDGSRDAPQVSRVVRVPFGWIIP